jgi:Tannase and feruloyl esterase
MRSLVIAYLLLGALPASAVSCESLLSAALPDTAITAAQSVPAGKFTPPYGNAIDGVPAFCRVAGVIKPTSDSYIRFEVWLPASGWNGKFLGIGNGGFAGAIGFSSLGANLKRGYATAGTDTGHEADGEDASWAYHHPEKVNDFGYRALHLTTENAKSLIQTFYGKPAQHSYFDSCSDGGREALIEAQRFPADYDGILAGAPANFWTHMVASGVDVSQAMYNDPASYISSIKIPAISAAVLAACDAEDGVKDGIVNDPARCRFDPSALLCKDVDSRDCLTAPQVASLKKLYAGGRNSHADLIFPGYAPGAEDGRNGWIPWIIGDGPGGSSSSVYIENYFRYMVFEDPTWNLLTANVNTAVRAADKKTARALNATETDLHNFQARGGKLILYHGWSDPAISPFNTINYYNGVVQTMGVENAGSFVRLYMVPGMQHCIGGKGPDSFGQLGTTTAKGPEHGVYDALEQWVESGTAPEAIVATKYVDDNSAKGVRMTRPLCPYPQTAVYKGTGDSNDSANFECKSAR